MSSEESLKLARLETVASVRELEAEKQLAEARAEHHLGRAEILTAEVDYLKAQVELYQVRMGLVVPVPVQGAVPTEHKPIRKSREPFEAMSARVAKAQADANEEYWRKKAEAVDIAGVTSSESLTKGETDAASS